jgi:putative PIN family toxin of toxin-antitoxin system
VKPAVVYDTMLFFQEAARPQLTRFTFQAVREQRVNLCLSPQMLAEIHDVLTRPEHHRKFPALTPQAIDAFISEMTARGTVFEAVPDVFTWPQHPDDDHLFNLAIHARANYLVTWETRILRLATEATPAAKLLREKAPQLSIVSPRMLSDEMQLKP